MRLASFRPLLVLAPLAMAVLSACTGTTGSPAGGGSGARPEISVERNGTVLISNQMVGSSPALSISASVGVSASATFSVRNLGSATLAIGAITRPQISNLDFSSATISAVSIAPGRSATLSVSVTTDDFLPWALRVQIRNDDSDEDPFILNLSGAATFGSFGSLPWQETEQMLSIRLPR